MLTCVSHKEAPVQQLALQNHNPPLLLWPPALTHLVLGFPHTTLHHYHHHLQQLRLPLPVKLSDYVLNSYRISSESCSLPHSFLSLFTFNPSSWVTITAMTCNNQGCHSQEEHSSENLHISAEASNCVFPPNHLSVSS